MDELLHIAMNQFQSAVQTRSVDAADAVLDAGFALVLVHPEAVSVQRATWLAMLPDYVIHSYDVDESVVDHDDDVAVALHRVRMNAAVSGQDRSGTFVISDTWRRRSDRWQLWRRHSTPLEGAAFPSR